jgi:hypothetical protein
MAWSANHMRNLCTICTAQALLYKQQPTEKHAHATACGIVSCCCRSALLWALELPCAVGIHKQSHNAVDMNTVMMACYRWHEHNDDGLLPLA